MASQVLAFLRRSRRGTDWSQEEIAELYRIEHALLQARFSLETDRGVSDEGDPWFVFCRADGEVLVHITRSEEGYLLYGLGLPRPLTGRVIGDISKSFVNQIPLNIPVKRADGPQLFVHPAAALAIIIGMIFLANDDVALISSAQAAEASGGAEPTADSGVKASVLAVLGKFADGTLFGGERPENNHQEGNYLNIVCTIAAVMMGASIALDAGTEDFTQVVLDDTVAAVEPTHAPQSSSDRVDADIAMWVDASFDDPLATAHAAEASLAVPPQDDSQLSRAVSPSTIVEASPDIAQQAPAIDLRAILDHEMTSLAGDEVVFGQPKPILQAEASHATASAAPAAEAQPEAAKQGASSVAPAATNVQREDAGTASVEDTFHVLFKAVGLADNTQIDRFIEHASLELLESIPAPVIAAAEVVAFDGKAIDAADGGGAPTPVAHGKLFPLFDGAAQEILTRFLVSNPDAQAVFYQQNVVVYDGDTDFASGPVTVQVWEFDTGATIAIVGHADNPAVLT